MAPFRNDQLSPEPPSQDDSVVSARAVSPGRTRREFLTVIALSLVACERTAPTAVRVPIRPLHDLAEGDNPFPLLRLVVRREGSKLHAIDLICTHQTCLVGIESDGSFRCPCHGSRFDRTGAVIQGPAVVPLVHRKLERGPGDMIYALRNEQVSAEWRLEI